MYGLFGLFFLIYSLGSFEVNAEKERLAAEQAAMRAQQAELEHKANQNVADLARQAEELWLSGNLQGASDTLAAAKDTQHASDLNPVKMVEAKIANAKVDLIMAEAISAAEDGRLAIAKEMVVEAQSVENATNLKPVRALQKQLELVEKPQQIQEIMLGLTEEEFLALNSGTMPTILVTGLRGIDVRINEHIQQSLEHVKAVRKAKRDEEEKKQRIRAAAASFVKTGVGQKVPYHLWSVLGQPETLKGTDNQYWVVYLNHGDVSFVSEKSSDTVIFAAIGKNKAQEYLATKKAKRKELVEGQFSAWDGSHRSLTKLIKLSMNDPDSYEHVETVYWDMGDHLVVRTTFRGKNAFGGVVKNWMKAKVDFNGNIVEVIEQGS